MRGSAVRVRTLAGWLGRAVEGKTTFLGLACIYTLWLVLGELRYRYEMHAMGESSYLDTAWTLPSVLKPYGYTASWSCWKVGEVEVKQRGSACILRMSTTTGGICVRSCHAQLTTATSLQYCPTYIHVRGPS